MQEENKKILVKALSFGCRLNALETEKIQAFLLDQQIPAILVNSCAVTAEAERQAVMDNLLPRRVQEAILRSNDYAYDKNVEWKIYRALALPPLKRDLKLLRNAFSFLLRDLFNRHQK